MSKLMDSQGVPADYRIGDLLEYVYGNFTWRALVLSEIIYDEDSQEYQTTVLLLYSGNAPCVELVEDANIEATTIISRL